MICGLRETLSRWQVFVLALEIVIYRVVLCPAALDSQDHGVVHTHGT